MKRIAKIGATAVLALQAESAVWAAETVPDASEGTALEAVTVTARKRVEDLIDVPAPVTAITPTQMEALRLRDARDLMTLVPTAYLQEDAVGDSRDFSIRGVTTPNFFAESGVATYVDDVYSSGFISYPTQFYDIGRVEVLRGPQGALYGRDAVGGAVNVISQLPKPIFEASAQGTRASYDRYEEQGMLNVPLGGLSGVRLAGWHTKQSRGAYFNETLGEYIDKNDSAGGRFSLKVGPLTGLTWQLVFEDTYANTPGTFLYFPDAGETPKTMQRDTQPTNAFHSARLSSNLTYQTQGLGDFALIVGGRRYRLAGVEDTDLSADPNPSTTNAAGKEVTNRHNGVQGRFGELRWLSPNWGWFNLLGGIDYVRDSAYGDINTQLATYEQLLNLGLLPGVGLDQFTGMHVPVNLVITNDQSVHSLSEFLEGTFQMTEHWTLIADLRYSRDDKHLDFNYQPSRALQLVGGPAAGIGPPQSSTTTKRFTNFSPGVTLAWSPGEDFRAYAKVQTGFRAGGFNFNVNNTAHLPYDPETSINYEVGAKQQIWNGRAYLGVTAYVLRQHNVLVPFFDTSAPTGLQGYIANAGEARTNGVEVEGAVMPFKPLRITANLGYLDGRITHGRSGNGSSPTDISGRQIPSARHLTDAVIVDLHQPLFGDAALLADVSYTHLHRGYQDVENTLLISARDLVNASIGLEWSGISLRGFVENALDDKYDIAFGGSRTVMNGTSSTTYTGVEKAAGVTYGLTLDLKFKAGAK